MRTRRFVLMAVLATACLGGASAQTGGDEAATKPPAPRTVPTAKPTVPRRPSGPKVSALNVRVTSDREGPVGRTTLFLLDDNFETILKRAGYKRQMFFGQEQPLLNSFEIQARMIAAMKVANPLIKALDPEAGEEMIPPEVAEQFTLAQKALAAHTVAVTTTSSAGTGAFPRLPAGTYYIYGTASQYVKDGYTGTVNGSHVTLNERGHQTATIWNVRVVLKSGANLVKLTPDNATFNGN